MPLSDLSRRALLRTAAVGLAAAALPRVARAEEQQVSKAEAKYRDNPNGIQRCAICIRYRPPSRCELVRGGVSPNGWCQYFAGKEGAG
jgi:hypothetical protein